eukprot:EG_transcript_17316
MGLPGLLPWLLERGAVRTESAKLKNLLSPDRSVLVVDGSAFCYHAYASLRGCTDFLCGGQWTAFHRLVQQFVSALQGVGARLVFVADGPVGAAKAASATRYWTLALRKWYCGSLLGDGSLAVADRKLLLDVILGEVARDDPFHPDFVVEVGLAILHALAAGNATDVEVWHPTPDVEADTAVAAYCRTHRATVAALLADDNDFLLLDVGCPIVRLWGLNWEAIALGMDPEAKEVVRDVRVRTLLGNGDSTGLFAALAGCDFCPTYFRYAAKGGSRPAGQQHDPFGSALALAQEHGGRPPADAIAALAERLAWPADQESFTRGAEAAVEFFADRRPFGATLATHGATPTPWPVHRPFLR